MNPFLETKIVLFIVFPTKTSQQVINSFYDLPIVRWGVKFHSRFALHGAKNGQKKQVLEVFLYLLSYWLALKKKILISQSKNGVEGCLDFITRIVPYRNGVAPRHAVIRGWNISVFPDHNEFSIWICDRLPFARSGHESSSPDCSICGCGDISIISDNDKSLRFQKP